MSAALIRLVALGRSVECPGCRAHLTVSDGPTHAYLGASPACWALYRALLTHAAAGAQGTRLRRLAEDSYAVQHPGVPHRRSVQSVAVHLMGLCVLLERGGEERRLAPVLGRTPPRRTMDLHWLAPPEPNGRLTVVDATAATAVGRHAGAIEAWARDVWLAWAEHHATVRGWLDAPCVRVA